MQRQPWLCAVAFSTVAAVAISAQVATPSFEVASVRRSADQRPNLSGPAGYKGQMLTLRGQTLVTLIRFAYGVGRLSAKPFAEIEGEPRWSTDRFDIVATTDGQVEPPSSSTVGLVNRMMQSLLSERF